MPVVKVKKDGVWENVAGMSGHTHTKDEIIGFPTSLPANGGNADTLDGKHANEFAYATDMESVQREISVEKSRIDQLTKLEQGSTTGDAELQDIRVGYDGNVYDTAGEAVRQQVAAAMESGGLDPISSSLLIAILKNAVFTSDQSANIVALESALKSGGIGGVATEVGYYTVTNVLMNATSNNNATKVVAKSSYSAAISIDDNCRMQSINVSMDGVDITSIVYNDGVINIPSVTGNLLITVVGTKSVEEYALNPLFTTTYPDKTTYAATSLLDMSNGAAAVYAQSVVFEGVQVSGGTLQVDIDETKLKYCTVRIYLVDSYGNPYKHNMVLGGNLDSAEGPVSGDITNDISWTDPGNTVGIMHVGGTITCDVPDGYIVKWVYVGFNVAGINDGSHLLDEELLTHTKPIYALVDKIALDGEIVTAKIVKEV